MRGWAALVLATIAISPGARAESGVVIERATVPWSELERLLRSQDAKVVRPQPSAPLAYALRGFELGGTVEQDVARLELELEIQLLGPAWIEVPLLPSGAAIASVEIIGMAAERAVITRREDHVAFIGKGPGTAKLRLGFEMPLVDEGQGRRLKIAPHGLSGGRARLELDAGIDEISGRSRWRPVAGLRSTVEATIGKEGVDLVIGQRSPEPLVTSNLEDLEAVTNVTLGGSGVTRMRLRATPDESGVLEMTLPEGASAWKLFVDKRSRPVAAVSDGRYVRIPLSGESQVELVYTFLGEGLGIRGRHRIELPRLHQPVRSARWNLWLPDGLRYGQTQASLSESKDCEHLEGKVPIEAQGQCHGFSRPVLGPSAAYVEIDYDQL